MLENIENSSIKESQRTTRRTRTIHEFIDRHILILLFLPAFIVIFVLTIGPFIWAFGMSFTDYNLSKPAAIKFVGFETYKLVLTNPSFWNSVLNTLYLVAMVVVLETILGVLIALLLARQFRGVQIARSLMLIPLMTTPVVVALTWTMLFNMRFGWVNYFLGMVGIPKIDWLGSPYMAMPSIVIADIWAATPFMTTLILAGLLSLSDEPFEAAVVDGASPWQIFWRVTLPLIEPVLILTIMFRTVDAFKKFESILIMTAGGPGEVTTTINFLAFNTGIFYLRFADAAAMMVFMVAVMITISVLLIRLQRRIVE